MLAPRSQDILPPHLVSDYSNFWSWIPPSLQITWYNLEILHLGTETVLIKLESGVWQPVSVSSSSACQFYLLKRSSGSCLVLGTSPTHSATPAQALIIHFRGILLFTHQNNWGQSQCLFRTSKPWCRNAVGGNPFLCRQGRCFYYVPLATFPNPILLFSSLFRNCLEEPHEELPRPAPRSHTRGANVGPSPSVWSKGQRGRAGACRCLPPALAPRTGLQLTPNFNLW